MQQKSVQYSSSLDCLRTSWRNEGLSVFWKGSSPRVVRLSISGLVTFAIYENVVTVLKGFAE
jgi:solute carrier family 25 citrate transporter 1